MHLFMKRARSCPEIFIRNPLTLRNRAFSSSEGEDESSSQNMPCTPLRKVFHVEALLLLNLLHKDGRHPHHRRSASPNASAYTLFAPAHTSPPESIVALNDDGRNVVVHGLPHHLSTFCITQQRSSSAKCSPESPSSTGHERTGRDCRGRATRHIPMR